MPLEGFGSPVGVVSTDLTVVVDVQPVELIEPVWNRLDGRKHKKKQFRHVLRIQTEECNARILQYLKYIW